MKAHTSGRDNFYFQKALKKYCLKNFTWEIIEHCDSKEELDGMEFHYIKQYNSLRPGGYNLTLGGDGSYGYKATQETLAKQSGKNNHMYGRKGKNNPSFGLKRTEETKLKMSLAKIGRKVSEETKKKISLNSVRRYGKDHHNYGVSLSNTTKNKISKALTGIKRSKEFCESISKTHKNKIVSSETKNKLSKASKGKRLGPNNHNAKKYIITDTENNQFTIHGLANFCREYKREKLQNENLAQCANGKRRHHKGYKCRNYDELTDSKIPYYEDGISCEVE